jgi:hypothetical protein
MIWPTFRDLQSSHETLRGLENLCLLRLPEASAPSISEGSSSPLHASSSPCSAVLPGELSGSFWLAFIVVGAGEESPSRREIGLMFPRIELLPRHTRQVSVDEPYCRGGQLRANGLSSPPNNVISVFDGWPAWRVGRKLYLVDCFPLLFFLSISHSLSQLQSLILFVVSLLLICPDILRTRSSIGSNEQDRLRRFAPYSLVLPEARQNASHYQRCQVIPKDQRDQDIPGPWCRIWRRLPQCRGWPLVDRLQNRNTHVTLPSVPEIPNRLRHQRAGILLRRDRSNRWVQGLCDWLWWTSSLLADGRALQTVPYWCWYVLICHWTWKRTY